MIHDEGPDSAEDAPGAAGGSECVRRSVLRGAVVLGAVGIGGALSRIGAGSSDAASLISAQGATPITGAGAAAAPAAPAAAKPAAAAPAAGAKPAAAAPAAAKQGAAKGRAVGLASQVPVGGGVIFEKAQVVVTQPTAGVYKAFDANCTHQACLVVEVVDGTINCACHGAKFSITDGSNTSFFPITDPLPAKTVRVSGGKLIVT